MDAAVFYGSALVSLGASLLVVTRKNPIYGALFLVLFFATISLDFLILRAPFLAVIQVLVYAGAIMVLYLFVIMLLPLRPEEIREEVSRGRRALAGSASLVLFLLLAYAIRSSERVARAPDLAGPVAAGPPSEAGTTRALGEELFRGHILPFELTSVLILVAIIGAIYLTRRPAPAASPRAPSSRMAAGRDAGDLAGVRGKETPVLRAQRLPFHEGPAQEGPAQEGPVHEGTVQEHLR